MKINRRDFLKKILSAFFLIELLILIFGGIGKSDSKKKNKSLFKAGNIGDFKNGQTYLFSSEQFFLQRFDDGSFLALSIKCTHLACTVNANSKYDGFTCPCHSSKFGKYGEIKSSPANRPLDIFKIIIHDNEIYVDTHKPIKRSEFNKSQLSYC